MDGDGTDEEWRMTAALTVDLAAIRANYRGVAGRLAGATMGAVLKSDAYGLGLEPIGAVLLEEGCHVFWVNDPSEAERLARLATDPVTLFVLHGLQATDPAWFARKGYVPVLASLEEVERALGAAAAAGCCPRVAIQLDLGLGRMGLIPADVERLCARPGRLDGLEIVCWVTQLACYASPDDPKNGWAHDTMRDLSARLRPAPLSLLSSAGTCLLPPATHGDLVRVGSALYGIRTTIHPQNDLRPAISMTAPVLRVVELPAGQEIGYGGVHRLSRRSRIATLAVGYADGFVPPLARVARVHFDGWPAPIVGGLAMNLMMVDVTDLPSDLIKPGNRAELFGRHQRLEDLAKSIDWTPNALVTHMGGCARRRYVGGGIKGQKGAGEHGGDEAEPVPGG